MTPDTEALRAKFEREIGEAAPFPVQRYGDSYAHRICAWAWEGYRAGHADGVADERERCAQLCDKLSRRAGDAMDCRDAIRAGAKEPSDG